MQKCKLWSGSDGMFMPGGWNESTLFFKGNTQIKRVQSGFGFSSIIFSLSPPLRT